jgi:uncharacterized protein (UPF0332 family)
MATYQSVTADDRIDVAPHLERASASLRACELLHSEGLHADALTRAHQATVHAQRALLTTEKRAPNNVRDVQRLAALHFLATDQLDRGYEVSLADLALVRARADDQPACEIEAAESDRALGLARAFLADVVSFLTEAGYLA